MTSAWPDCGQFCEARAIIIFSIFKGATSRINTNCVLCVVWPRRHRQLGEMCVCGVANAVWLFWVNTHIYKYTINYQFPSDLSERRPNKRIFRSFCLLRSGILLLFFAILLGHLDKATMNRKFNGHTANAEWRWVWLLAVSVRLCNGIFPSRSTLGQDGPVPHSLLSFFFCYFVYVLAINRKSRAFCSSTQNLKKKRSNLITIVCVSN